MTTFIQHTFAADLDITVQSPAGTVVTLTTDNGAGNDNVFNGTVWDDSANPGGQVPYTTNDGLVTDHAYVNLTLASPLVPEEALGAFIGEDPNGTWTITISDDLAGDGGSLDSWSLTLATLPAGPTAATTTATNTTPVAIPTGPAVVTSTTAVSGAGTSVVDVNLQTSIQHTFAADLDITVQSPAGTVVTLTTDNGAGNDDVFNGTLWDDSANPGGQVPYTTNDGLVTDHAYVNLTLASPLVPEEAMAAFIGEDPNGTWTITISDDLPGDGGSLNDWSLTITTGTCSLPPAPIVPPINLPTPPPRPPSPPVPIPLPLTAGQVAQIGGTDRAATAILVSRDAFPASGSAGAVVIATGLDFPDALAGTPLAKVLDGPVLLSTVQADRAVKASSLSPDTLAELQRVLPAGGSVYVLGGPAAVSASVDGQLQGLGYVVSRLAGPTRYDTAVAIANALGNPTNVILATGTDFPDALSGGAAAAKIGGAVLLTDGDTIPPATGAYIAGKTTYAVGGPAAAASPSSEAIVGADRYATAAAVATRWFSNPSAVGVATGLDFPDALTGGAHIAIRANGPILLTQTTALPAPTDAYLVGKKVPIDVAFVYGGPTAVAASVIQAIQVAIT
ncbi:MAG: cell wall-binding repeat-containing protein [Acidimicrobiales bacterium]|nr:cell wall-binding repeat-containing protein [Acidimicrobiales bacterium]